ncbi:hypothetical protein [Rheinheimera gaetbuli]
MKWIIMLAIAAISAALFLPVAVTGSVYVVTNGKETVNMPLTEVRVYDKKQFLKAWDEQSVNRLNSNCNQGPTELEKSQLDLRRMREGPDKVPQWKEMDTIYNACSFDSLIWSNPAFRPVAMLYTDKNGGFEFSQGRFTDVIMFSKGSRKVIGHEEQYIWLQQVPAKASALSQQIEINNAHLVNELRVVDYPMN